MIRLKDGFLTGSYPPLVTPFKNGAVDYETYARLVERQVAEGSHGIVVNGTTAEPSTLSVDERNRLVETAVRAAAGRIPVVAATGSQSHADTVAMTAAAEKAGADALLVVTPYFVRPPQRGLVEYYLDIGQRTGLPLLIYHIPGRTAVNMTVDSIAAVAEKLPTLVGMKHAVNDLTLVTEVLARLGSEFRVFVGLEDLSFPMMALGAQGVMNAVGNLMPKEVALLCEHVLAGRLSAARAAHFTLFELNQAVFFDTNPIPMKYMMKRLGILPNEEHRLPMVPATPELAQRLDQVLDRAGALVASRPRKSA
ncbi:MAG TPA: 4-hydroxy-tetrahydrodipicolinate synthase [Stellaceae bacterium]|nr:4-hydroxy-tetrahydrodipicolinate synthase [Stellaceae bacterium]